ncbi:penicillin-insensitive murein endopeptidase [Vibrio intestinalis]|uniref:penicillin-insensitive murein endopeptidase n=1 Tax=Vibrio intestinalis TaxID=2933291 RepID=UPI0021A79C07|nr:penicillin-insensitive murein endopeptidase [Vibrio intestinalis]
MKVPWIGLILGMCSLAANASPWESFTRPSVAPSESIGSYANGCLIGAEALPLNGHGYQVLRSQNKRYFGHPDTVSFIERLAKQARKDLRTHILIGDMSLPQGGRFSSGHSSHQTGLDVDIWFRLADSKLSQNALSLPKPQTLVNMSEYTLSDNNWGNRHFRLIKMAAQDDQVARIFVHPVIKEKLCSTEGAERDWLRKVRPWWGHNYHMHVRLLCPQGDNSCINQAPPPKGDGCGKEVASWRPKPEVKELRAGKKETEKKQAKVTKPKPKKILPKQCAAIISSL